MFHYKKTLKRKSHGNNYTQEYLVKYVLCGTVDSRLSKVVRQDVMLGIISDRMISSNMQSPNKLLVETVADKIFVIRESPFLGPWNGKSEDAQPRELQEGDSSDGDDSKTESEEEK